ncbi:hypothetical protein [Parasitella parasitica]|uniref:protein-tyrosine-phosphatase n=1 Tax=Parasitella parasitica TaxID=35722 RepID=A0A0B7N7N7_9FUNG|nr:hypothetical protein [Parasitella parasitica]
MLETTSPSLSKQTAEAVFPSYTEDHQVNPAVGATPYYTASAAFPHLQNQDFFNAIENRFNLNGLFVKEQQKQMDRSVAPHSHVSAALVSLNGLKSPALKNNKQHFETIPLPLSVVNSGLNVNPFTPKQVNDLLDIQKTLILDVRSFVKYNQLHIRNSINIAVPNTILRRPSFTLEKVTEAIVTESGRLSWRNWMQMTHVILYDDHSNEINEASPNAIYYLSMKLLGNGDYQGIVGFLHGGMSAFTNKHAISCIGDEPKSTLASTLAQTTSPAVPPTPDLSGLPPVVLGSLPMSKARTKRRPIDGLHLGSLPQAPITSNSISQFENQAFNPFFSNIRQNMELSHGSITERFPVRFPNGMHYDANTGSIRFNGKLHQMRRCASMPDDHTLPPWLQKCIAPDTGPNIMAEYYEAIERSEQKRLKGVMLHHSKVTDNLTDHPFSIVAAIEKGALNRYTNIWPFDVDTAATSSSNQVPTLLSLKEQNDACTTGRHYTKYISTQGPLPTTFDDFWTVVWDENSRVIVMLTKEEEMNRIKCHRYWPTEKENMKTYGTITVKFMSETKKISKSTPGSQNDVEEGLILRHFEISKDDQEPRFIQHLQYKGWQDYGVPDNPIGTLELVTLAQEWQSKLGHSTDIGPMIVHCSAGCGRTGAFCTIETLMTRLSDTNYLTKEEQAGKLDLVFQTVSKLREQRVSMVQTLRQYVFCYEAILWWILDVENAQQ